MGASESYEQIKTEVGLVKQQSAVSVTRVRTMCLVVTWVHVAIALAILFATVGSYTWTTDDHPWTSIPWYTEPLKTWRMNMWGVEHVFLLLTIPMYLFPGLTMGLFASNPTSSLLFWLHMISGVVILICDMAMFVWDFVKWGYCDEWALCRGQDPLGDPGHAVLYWYFEVFGNIAMAATTAIMLLLSGELYKQFDKLSTQGTGVAEGTSGVGKGTYVVHVRYKNLCLVLALLHFVLAVAALFPVVGSYTWTSDDHPWSSVPWYTEPLKAWRMNMWGVEHVFMLLSIPMYVLPSLTLATYVANPQSSFGFWTHAVTTAAILVWDAAMFVLNFVKWGQCPAWVMCRGQNPTGSPWAPVMFWFFAFFGHLFVSGSTAFLLFFGIGLGKAFRPIKVE